MVMRLLACGNEVCKEWAEKYLYVHWELRQHVRKTQMFSEVWKWKHDLKQMDFKYAFLRRSGFWGQRDRSGNHSDNRRNSCESSSS